MSQGQLRVSFYFIIVSQGIGLIGSNMLRFAVSLHVLGLTGSAEIFAAMVAVSFLPTIFFAPLGGAIADRFPKKKLMVACDAANTCLVGLLALLLFGGSESIVLIGLVITLMTVVAVCYHPVVASSLPLILEQEELAGANGIVQGLRAASTLVSPLLAGFLFGLIGVHYLISLCAALFLFSTFINVFIKIPHKAKELKAGMLAAIFGDLKEGFLHITKKEPLLFKLALVFATVVFFYTSILSVAAPYLIRVYFAMSEQFLAIANMGIGLSVLCASLLAGRLKRFLTLRYLPSYICVIAVTTIPIALAVLPGGSAVLLPFFLLVISCMCIIFLFSLFDIGIITHIQTNVPADMVGKVAAMLGAIANLFTPVGQLFLGVLIESLGEMQFVLYLGISLFVFVIGFVARRKLMG